MSLIPLLIAGVIAAPTCQPDLVTQEPVRCEARVEAPFVGLFPVEAQTAEVSISTATGHRLFSFAVWGCLEWLRRRSLIALVSRCSGSVGIAVFRTRRKVSRAVRIAVYGGPV